MLTTGDAPQAAERPEPCRDLPAEAMRAPTARLDDLERGSCGPEIRTGIELLIDTGRRPAEIASLVFDCLTRDAGGRRLLRSPQRHAALCQGTSRCVPARLASSQAGSYRGDLSGPGQPTCGPGAFNVM
jgi:hypothetical protein